jgi:hypothetical protein
MKSLATPSSAAHTCGPRLPLGLFLLLPFFLVACEVIEVNQPSEATQGEVIDIEVGIGIYVEDSNPWHGVLSILVPEDWSFVSATYSGDLGSGSLLYSEAWSDSTTIILPPPEGMKWIGTISDEARAVPSEPAYVEATLRLEVGQQTGTFGLGYFFTSNAWDTDDIVFSESGDFDDNNADVLLDQPITVLLATSTEDGARPNAFALVPNFPNPFTTSTQVGYVLDRAASVRVAVYDLAGREVAVIDEGFRSAGAHGVEFHGAGLPSGTYLYNLEVDGETVQTRRMTRLR